MTNKLPDTDQNTPVGFIRPNGAFVRLRHGSHLSDARSMGTSLTILLRKGWIRNAGQGAYEGNLTPITLLAVENDLSKDYGDMKTAERFGRPVELIVLERSSDKTSIAIRLETFEEAGFDLRRAICQSKNRAAL